MFMGNIGSWQRLIVMVVAQLLLRLCWERSDAIRFVIEKEECLSQKVHYEGDFVTFSFVVIKSDSSWHYDASHASVDLLIKGPSGEQIHEFRDKSSEMFEFMAQKRGIYQLCFTNKSPYHEYVDLDVHVGHLTHYNQPAKDEHLDPLLEQISKLEAALYNIQSEQHWLQALNARHASVNEGMSRSAITKAIVESVALVGVSVLQVFLLQRLLQKKLRSSRV